MYTPAPFFFFSILFFCRSCFSCQPPRSIGSSLLLLLLLLLFLRPRLLHLSLFSGALFSPPLPATHEGAEEEEEEEEGEKERDKWSPWIFERRRNKKTFLGFNYRGLISLLFLFFWPFFAPPPSPPSLSSLLDQVRLFSSSSSSLFFRHDHYSEQIVTHKEGKKKKRYCLDLVLNKHRSKKTKVEKVFQLERGRSVPNGTGHWYEIGQFSWFGHVFGDFDAFRSILV